MEMLARAAGFFGMPSDDPGLWGLARASVREYDRRQVVFVGASRTHLGINLAEFASAFGGPPPIQLAIDGSSPLPVLHHLADQEGFQGIVVYDLMPNVEFSRKRLLDDRPKAWIAAYDGRSWNALFERRLKMEFELLFACVCERFRLKITFDALWNTGRFPHPMMVYGADRSILADLWAVDFSDTGKWEVKTSPEPMNPGQTAEMLSCINRLVDRIRFRGGQVVFVRFPAGGAFRTAEERYFPRRVYWKALVESTKAITIHYEDYPKLRNLPSPDGSHLDYRDAEVFTRALAGIIKEKLGSRAE